MRAVVARVVVVGGLAVGCSGNGDSGSTIAVQRDERAAYDAEWDAYAEHRARFSAGEFPLPAGTADCPPDSACPLGWMIGAAFYEVVEPLPDEIAVGRPIATLPDADVYLLDGAEPAAWLVVDGEDGLLLLESTSIPTFATSKDRAVELRSARCSIVGVVDTTAEPTDCGWGTVRWNADYVELPWDVNDPAALSDRRVWRTEPVDDVLAAGLGPPIAYPTERAALDDLAVLLCGGSEGTGCVTDYDVDERVDGRTTVTVVTARTVGDDARRETYSWRRVLERLDDGRWWWTEDGPLAVDQ